MRVIVNDAKPEFSRVIRAIEQDPTSWDGWLCAHIMIREDHYYTGHTAPIAYAIAEMSRCFKTVEGITYVVDGAHMYLMCRGVTRAYLHKRAHEVAVDLNIKYAIDAGVIIFDLKKDWKDLVEIGTEHGYWKLPNAFFDADHLLHNELLPIENVDYIMQESSNLRRYRDCCSVMLVEDDPITRRLFARVLNERHELFMASNAKAALTEYILQAPDIVFLDIGLPDHTGFELMHAIFAHDPEAYIVMFSGQDDLQNLTDSIHLGARGFVGKPFHEDRLNYYIQSGHLYHKANA